MRAWTLGEVAAAVDVELGEHVLAALNGDQITRDPELPLAAGDTVALMVADAGGWSHSPVAAQARARRIDACDGLRPAAISAER